MNVATESIRPNPYQPRREFPPEEIAELARSMNQHGLLQPIVVRPAKGGYELIAGERRLVAARALQWPDIPATVREDVVDDIHAGVLAITENVQREDVDPLSMARALQRLMAASEKRGKRLSVRMLASRFDKSPGWVQKRLDLLKVKPDVQQLVSAHPDTLSSALEINRVPDDETRAKLIRLAAEGAPFVQIQEGVEKWRADQRWKAEGSRPDAATRKHTRAAEERQAEALRQCKAAVQELTRFAGQLESWLPECARADAAKSVKPGLAKVRERLAAL